MSTLEQRCRRLVEDWLARAKLMTEVTGRRKSARAITLQIRADELLAILPKRKAKKPREEIRYGGTPPALRRKAKKGAKR